MLIVKVLADTLVYIPVITMILKKFLVKNLLYLQVSVEIHFNILPNLYVLLKIPKRFVEVSLIVYIIFGSKITERGN